MRRLAVLALFATPGLMACQGGVPVEEAVASITEEDFHRYKWDMRYSEESWVAENVRKILESPLPEDRAVREAAARGRLAQFIGHRVADYAEARDFPGVEGTSRLSENLTYGEISPRTAWHSGMRALHEGKHGAETFLKELVWREFAYHLAYHTPRIVSGNWREEWDAFPWNEDAGRAEVQAWMRGRTGMAIVDAAMREISAAAFVRQVLVHGLNVRHLVVGDDFRFARRREGSLADLMRVSEALDILRFSLPGLSLSTWI